MPKRAEPGHAVLDGVDDALLVLVLAIARVPAFSRFAFGACLFNTSAGHLTWHVKRRPELRRRAAVLARRLGRHLDPESRQTHANTDQLSPFSSDPRTERLYETIFSALAGLALVPSPAIVDGADLE